MSDESQRREVASQDNVELFQRGIDAINAGDFSGETFATLCTPDFWMQNPTTAVTDKSYQGADGHREWAAEFLDAFGADGRLELETVLAHGENFVVSRLRWTGHGSRSGAPLVLKWFTVMWFRDGLMCRGMGYMDRDEALEAAGLGSDVTSDTGPVGEPADA